MTDRLVIDGRSRYFDQAVSLVTIEQARAARREILAIGGGSIEVNGNRFTVSAKHPTGVDDEHDSAYAVVLEGYGLTLSDVFGPVVSFTGWIHKAAYYPPGTVHEDEECHRGDECADGGRHPRMRFTPPAAQWTPGEYTVTFRSDREGIEEALNPTSDDEDKS